MDTGRNLQTIHPTMPGRDLTAYVASVNSISVLTPEQERELATSTIMKITLMQLDSWS